MPYINCNGETKSRYDTSQEVKDCIAQEEAAYKKAYDECTASVECLAEREARIESAKEVGDAIDVLFVVIALAVLVTRACIFFREKKNSGCTRNA